MSERVSWGLIELGLVFGSVLGLLVWELISVRRAQRRHEDFKPRARTER
ncbi:MAG TPA: hypothetical protein VI258_02330 [Rhodanobacteraceae bacterium]